jgi:hypothetical protein
MLESIKRWFGFGSSTKAEQGLQSWADSRGLDLRSARETGGFLVEGAFGRQAWRLEWGPSQRSFIAGRELRLIAEMEIHRELQVLVLNRELIESLEKSVFDQFVDTVQTRADADVPLEARWLVMFPKLSSAELRELSDLYGATSNVKPWLLQWLAGPMGAALNASSALLAGDAAVVWTVARGRLTLRTAMPLPTAESVAAWHSTFETAMREVRRVSDEFRQLPPASPTTQPAWVRTDLSSDAMLEQ